MKTRALSLLLFSEKLDFHSFPLHFGNRLSSSASKGSHLTEVAVSFESKTVMQKENIVVKLLFKEILCFLEYYCMVWFANCVQTKQGRGLFIFEYAQLTSSPPHATPTREGDAPSFHRGCFVVVVDMKASGYKQENDKKVNEVAHIYLGSASRLRKGSSSALVPPG